MVEVEVFDDRVCDLGEGPYYDEVTGRVVWVDILGRRVLWREIASTGSGELAVSGHVGAAVPRRDGGLVLCLPDGPVLAAFDGIDSDGGPSSADYAPMGSFAEADRAAGVVASSDSPSLRANDAKVDPSGRLWLGTMAYDGTAGAGALYRLDPGQPWPRRVLGDITTSNGLGWSPDRSTMYYIDTPTRRIDAFGFDIATGELGERRVFVEIDEGFPDGMCVDAEGGVWVALWQGSAVRRYTTGGRLDRVVAVPTPQVTSCAFAGAAHQTLIITTAAHNRPGDDRRAGLTYAYEPGDVAGVPVDRFGA